MFLIKFHTVFFLRTFSSSTQVETCQEKIISLELQDPITNATLSESQILAGTLSDPVSANITPSDDENSSIITVRSNASAGNANDNTLRLHLAVDNDDDGGAGNENASSELQSGSENSRSFLTAASPQLHQQQATHTDGKSMQTIVEVVNPLISGDGYANKIAVGRSDDCSYPSFDENDNGNAADDELDSLNAYNTASELSLSDKMKNVLQELVSNERVRLSFSQSISEDDDDDDEDDDDDSDTDVDDEIVLKHDELDAGSPLNIHHGEVVANVNIDDIAASIGEMKFDAPGVPDASRKTNESESPIDNNAIFSVSTVGSVPPQQSDDIKNANVFGYDIIYQNPNFLTADDEFDAHSSSATTAAAQHQQKSTHEKLKEKLLSELNVDEQRRTTAASLNLDIKSDTGDSKASKEFAVDADDNDESSISYQEIDIPSVPTTPTESSSKSTNSSSATAGGGSGKRKKRKGKGKKK